MEFKSAGVTRGKKFVLLTESIQINHREKRLLIFRLAIFHYTKRKYVMIAACHRGKYFLQSLTICQMARIQDMQQRVKIKG